MVLLFHLSLYHDVKAMSQPVLQTMHVRYRNWAGHPNMAWRICSPTAGTGRSRIPKDMDHRYEFYLWGYLSSTYPFTGFLVNDLLQSPYSIILIHVDQKADLAPFHTQFGQHDQVYFLADRIDVRWGSYSQIEVMLQLLQEAQKYDYRYFFSLSGD